MAGKLSDQQPSSSSSVEKRTKKKKKIEDERVAFYKLFSFADRLDITLMIVGTIGALGNGLMQPLFTLLLGELINSFGGADPSNVVHRVSKVSLQFVYVAVVAGIASLLQMSCWMVTGERQATRIRGLYLTTILRQDIEFFDTQTTTGEVIGRMSGDTILIQQAMGEKVGNFIQCTSTFFGGFIIAFSKGWLLALVLSTSVPALIITGASVALVTSKMASQGQFAYAGAGTVVEQTIGAIRTVQSYTGEGKASEKYDSKLEVACAATIKQSLVSGVGGGLMMLILFSSYGLTIWYGAKLIIDKGYTGGSVINILMAILIGGISLGQVAPSLNVFAAGRAAAYKMFETIERKPKIDASDNSGIVLADIKGEIELKDVYFKYPARPEVQIFAGFSLHVPSGKTAALVGQSGSGKSTVISLLERFYDPDAGQVCIDGVDLKKLRLKWIRGNMGLVSQEPILFATTVKENILYGKEDATDEEIRKAIELANAAKFIDKLPLGLDTMVGEHGTQLSGGQKQRIAIARAILKNPKMLLLDEATSALDAESERIVQDALDNVMTNRTTVIVAHRLTTIRNADFIAVIHGGKLVEQGTHNELLKDPEGAYSLLVRMQEGSKETETQKEFEPCKANDGRELNHNLSNSPGQRISMKRSTSNGSSVSYNIPSFVDRHDNKSESEKKAPQKRKKVSIKRLAYLNKPETLSLVLGSLGSGLYGVTYPMFGILVSSAINSFFEPPEKMHKDSEFWGLMFFIMGLCMIVVIPMQSYFFGVAGGKLIMRIRSLSFKKVVHQEISWFDDPANSSGGIGARLSTDAATVRSLVGDALGLIVQNMTTVIVGLVIAFWANWILALVILAVFPLVGMQGLMHSKLGKGFSADAKVMYEEASQVANDAVGSIRTVSSFSAEDKVMKIYEKNCEEPLRQGVRLGVLSGVGFGIGSLALFCSQAFCFYIGALLIEHGKASVGGVFTVFFALTMSAMGVSQTSAAVPDVNKVKDSAASIFEILDSKPKIDSSSDEGMTLSAVRGDIEFLHVSFKYPARPDVQIFKDLSLHITSGQTVALVGTSGSGKSTVISLIERFYSPDSGQILLDGVEIDKFKLSWLRQQMGLVSQEPILFNETMRSNIAYGKKGDVTEEEIIKATKAANAYNFISGLPQGFDTNVGERGVQLSGGQKQRIAIARAILKDPKILLLDEATSALDAESEQIVQDALDKVMVNRTTVVVAHRLSTIKGADVIAVVKNGEIAEKGSHDALMKIRNGVYASLVALQTS